MTVLYCSEFGQKNPEVNNHRIFLFVSFSCLDDPPFISGHADFQLWTLHMFVLNEAKLLLVTDGFKDYSACIMRERNICKVLHTFETCQKSKS